MNKQTLPPGEMSRHLRLMRGTTVVFMLAVPVAVAVILLLPRREASVSPLAVTLVAAAAALWVGFTANRDAQARLDKIKRAFAVHGDERRLLSDLRLVNLAVLARLEVMVTAAVVAAVWGRGSAAAWGILALAGMMMALTWPTEDKSHSLLERARERRGR
jgi:hypothetical protein